MTTQENLNVEQEQEVSGLRRTLGKIGILGMGIGIPATVVGLTFGHEPLIVAGAVVAVGSTALQSLTGAPRAFHEGTKEQTS